MRDRDTAKAVDTGKATTEWIPVSDPDAEKIAELIKKALCGRSQRSFSKESGISYQTIYRYSSPRNRILRPLKSVLIKIADTSRGTVSHEEMLMAAGYMPGSRKKPAHSVKDHLGNSYPSVHEMCAAYGISRQGFYTRINSGLTLEDALTKKKQEKGMNTPVKGKHRWKESVDHRGKKYRSFRSMCMAYGKYPANVYRHLSCGDTLEEALAGEQKHHTVEDHKGVKYDTKKIMCLKWGIPYNRFMARLRRGWTIEEALTTDSHEHVKKARKGAEVKA